MARKELGNKWTCESCGVKFFDLNKDPITCPSCKTVIPVVTTKVTSKKWRNERPASEQPQSETSMSDAAEDADSDDDEEETPNDQVDPGFDNLDDLMR